MKDLMKINCYDASETMVIVGSCLNRMQPKAFEELEKMSDDIFEVCLENTHINMVITKLIGILCRAKVKTIIFATVDKSPHCIQLHYIENEIQKAMKLDEIKWVHYVAVNNKLIEISSETIKKSKALSELQKMQSWFGDVMIKLVEFSKEFEEEFIKMKSEWDESGTSLVPDIMLFECKNHDDYLKVLEEVEKQKEGTHEDTDWYERAFYYLAVKENGEIIGVCCVRYNLTEKGYYGWGNIAYGVRPSERRKGYATEIAKLLTRKCRELGMNEVVLCHFAENEISPKIFKKLGAEFTNNFISNYSQKEVKRYILKLK